MKIDNSQINNESGSEGKDQQHNISQVGRDLKQSKGIAATSCDDHDTSLASPVDTIPFSIEGIQTVVKNRFQRPDNVSVNRKSVENGFSMEDILRYELKRYKEENSQLKAALKEAAKVNQQWRNYHDQRQGYVHKLLATIHDLRQAGYSTQAENTSNLELMKLKETLSRQQKDHREHIQLLELQVKAHRDDWEAERNEKRNAEAGRAQAESQVALLQEQLEQATIMLEDLDCRLKYCKCSPFSTSSSATTPERGCVNGTLSPTNGHLIQNRSEDVAYRNSYDALRSSSGHSSVNDYGSPDTSRRNSSKLESEEQLGNMVKVPKESLERGYWVPATKFPSRLKKKRSSSSLKRSSSSLTPEPVQEDCAATNKILRNLFPDEKLKSAASEMNKATGSKPNNDTAHDNIVQYHKQHEISCSGDISSCTDDSSTYTRHDIYKGYYESKGARPKVLNIEKMTTKEEKAKHGVGTMQIEDDRQAKHRARSILASALPMSPSSSLPTSPVTGSLFKTPYSGIVHGHTQCPPTTAPKLHGSLSSQSQLAAKPDQLDNARYSILYSKEEVGRNKMEYNGTVNRDGINEPDNKDQSQKLCTKYIPLMDSHSDSSLKTSLSDHSHQSTVQKLSSLADENNFSNKRNKNDMTDDGCKLSTSNGSETMSTFQLKQTRKPLTITNTQQQKLVTNYATISVMPSPSSAIYSSSLGASVASSRSSSPGISLTTFALNSQGQGIPGAIFFALGPDTKAPIIPAAVIGNSIYQSELRKSPEASPDNSTGSSERCKLSNITSTTTISCNGLSKSLYETCATSTAPSESSKMSDVTTNIYPCLNALCTTGNIIKSDTSTCENKLSMTHKAVTITRVDNKLEGNPISKEKSPNGQRIINSAWLKLIDNENNPHSSTGTPWRTARAVPSHQLNSVKRNVQEDSANNETSRQNDLNNCSSGCTGTTGNHKTEYSTDGNKSNKSVPQCTVRPSHPNCNKSPLVSNSAASVNPVSSVSLTPQCGIFQFPAQSRSHLMSLASKNIISAILNYEQGHRLQGPSKISKDTQIQNRISANFRETENGKS